MGDDAKDPRAAARRWLGGDYKTWRWNDGSYERKNRYEAVETTPDGLLYFGFDGARSGVTYRRTQGYDAFAADGPLLPLPEHVERELRGWLSSHRDRAASSDKN